MRYVEFYDLRNGMKKYLGEIRIVKGRLEISDELAPHWQGSYSYALLANRGYEGMYEPEKMLDELPLKFNDPAFSATEVKYR